MVIVVGRNIASNTLPTMLLLQGKTEPTLVIDGHSG